MFRMYGLDMQAVEEKLSKLKHDVNLIYFTREANCNYCQDAKRLYERLASITRKINLEVYNFAINREKDTEYGIFTVPALAIIGEKDFNIRYYGYPKGLELNNLLDILVYVSRGESNLPPSVLDQLSQLDKEVNLKIFISPTCSYSLPAANLGVKLAIASNKISVDIIHALEFMEISEKYKVQGIPMTVVNDNKEFYGALKEDEYVAKILELV